MNPTKPISFAGGSTMPQAGTEAYKQAQQGIAPQGFTGVTANPSPITVDTLTTNPTTTTVPTPVNNNTAQTNLGMTASSAVSTTPPSTTTTTPTDTATTKKAINDKLLSILGTQEGKSDFVAQQQKEQQLAEKNAQLTSLNNQALDLQKAYDSQIKEIKDQTGLTESQKNKAITDISSRKNDALSAVRIDQAIAQNNVALAQQTIKDIVDAKYEPLDNQLKTLQIYREFINNDLTEEEKIKLTAQENQLEKNAQSIRDTGKTVLENVIQNGGTSVIPAIQKAMDEENRKLQENPNYTPDVTKIYAAAGNYAQDKTKVLDAQYKQKEIDKKDTRSYTETDASGKTTLVTIDGQTGALISKTDLGNIGKPTGKGGANGGGKAVYTDPRSLPESLKNSLLDDIVLNHGTPDQLYAAYPEINKTTIKDLYEHFSLQGTNLNPAPTNKKTSTTTGVPGLK